MSNLYFVTGNQFKFQEAQSVIPELLQIDFDTIEIQSADEKEVISHKIKQVAEKHPDKKLVVEDVSLKIHSLNNFPGTFTKWLDKIVGNEKTFKMLENFEDRSVTAISSLGYFDGKDIHFVVYEMKGEIVSPRGENGFGWDPIFKPEGSDKTLAEMTLEEKNKYSMRRMAFEKLRELIK